MANKKQFVETAKRIYEITDVNNPKRLVIPRDAGVAKTDDGAWVEARVWVDVEWVESDA